MESQSALVSADSLKGRRAAIYVRMSSDQQSHSILHQCDRLNEFAREHGIEVVMMYADAGKSGLRINGRDGLQGLISDVQARAAGFDLILVHDVSRWGRFQDIDESAYYEFICRKAGVQVIYCAENFSNDGSPMYALMKGLKRIMAAEYSRELGEKVLRAQSRFSGMGFKQGGRPGYGLHRAPVSQNGLLGQPLKPGERKPAATDRVALVHGSSEEVAVVRRIYHLYVTEGWSDSRIAALLRAEGGCNHMGKPWDPSTVRRILTNSRYYGEIVYNQTSRRLQAKVSQNPEHLWIRCPNALDPMISRTDFELAQKIRQHRASGPTSEDILEQLRALYNRHGTINESLCRQYHLPGRNTILRLFGGYIQAYKAAGLPFEYSAKGALGIRTMRTVVEQIMADTKLNAIQAGATVQATEVWNVIQLNNEVRVKISVASCRQCNDGWQRWRIPLRCGAKSDFVICGLMNDVNQQVSHYLLLPMHMLNQGSISLRKNKMPKYREHLFDTLDQIFGNASTA